MFVHIDMCMYIYIHINRDRLFIGSKNNHKVLFENAENNRSKGKFIMNSFEFECEIT